MNRIVAVDFDGTCVTHEYPRVGDDVPHTLKVLKRPNQAGKLIASALVHIRLRYGNSGISQAFTLS